MKRRDVSEYLHISMDTLRNWEMNGLLQVLSIQVTAAIDSIMETVS